ncbi:sulfotransferase family 2 domain-containing protein [Pseudooceanicola aestuarii]|uniref:sulfotransferase family 2 domain-containing protein n=1 Tax=Pseudooceanicola aestuarii TaxID=2697319 RepID=UPI0013D1280A|nr:sulfotransferase family 2 domain-containing protein [Pseudooceanicola aestuarii]
MMTWRFGRARAQRLPICVFAHIPRTGGQAVHAALMRVYGRKGVSPVRVHTQACSGQGQFPRGYRLYSGHLDWDAADFPGGDNLVFTLLRNPEERIASFYYYLRHKAAHLDPAILARPEYLGLHRALIWSPSAYFQGGDAIWRNFIRDHYDNAQTRYLATGRVRGSAEYDALSNEERLTLAETNAKKLNRVFFTDAMEEAATGMSQLLARNVDIPPAINAGPRPGAAAWPRLLSELDPVTARQVSGFVVLDRSLISRLRAVQ